MENNKFTVVPNVYDEIARKEFSRRELTVTGPLSEDQAHLFGMKLRYLVSESKNPITIYLNTPGGSISDGLAMYDEILSAKEKGVKINIVAVGSCMSMGCIVLQAANKRLSYKNTSFLLHELAMAVAGSLGVQKDAHGRALKLQNILNGILTGKSKLNEKSLAALQERQDRYLDAKEMKKHGLLDGIL